MSEIIHIALGANEPCRVTAGEHYAGPLLVETGSRSARIVLEAGARLHMTAFVLAVGGTVGEVADRAKGAAGETQKTKDGAADREAKLSLSVDLVGEGAEFHLHGLYIASGRGTDAGSADIDVKVNHLAPNGVSRQLIKGIATDTATGSFTGMVHVAPGAQKSDASQRNQNLQLSDTAHIFTRPGLEIYADDVRCGHGATVGRLDEEAVYYMRQRGVSEAEARRMQMQGFAGEIINHCPSESSREAIGEKISALIDRF